MIEKWTKDNWGIVRDTLALRPIADRILIVEDEFKSRFDCSACGGKGHTEEICPRCLGRKFIISKLDKEETPCPDCSVRAERTITYGKVPCSVCNGQGGSIIIPEDAKKRPTTGLIIAIGTEVTEYKVGTKVLYHNYAGTEFEMEKVKIRIMKQHDVLCEVRGLKDNLNPKVHQDLVDAGIV